MASFEVEGTKLNPRRLWFLMLLAGVANLLPCTGQAAAQTKIAACNTIISTAGSYVVTANLTASSASTPCIKVTTGFVTINLNGFVLTGTGGGQGISASASPLTITNGFIKSFSVGISAPVPRVKLTGITLLSNKGAGASLGDNAESTDSKFINNSADGLDVGKNALITQCTFLGNSGNGLKAGTSAVVTENVASSNGSTIPTSIGFETDGNATVSGNAASANTAITDGFGDAGGGSTFEGNTASSNGPRVLPRLMTTRLSATAPLATTIMASMMGAAAHLRPIPPTSTVWMVSPPARVRTSLPTPPTATATPLASGSTFSARLTW